MTAWTTPADLKTQLQRFWDQGTLLRASLTDEALFPLQLRLKKPDNQALAERFDEVRQWIRLLQAGEGHYRLQWKEINHRQLGRNQVPDGAWIGSLDAALALLGRRREAERFRQLAEASLAAFPELHGWLCRYPLRALDQAEQWNKTLTVLHWFRANPKSGLYLRQADIPGIETNFIEQRRGLLSELLDLVLPAAVIDVQARGARAFSRRYGLIEKPVRVRLRALDPGLAISGLNDLEVPVDQLDELQLRHRRVFVTENETNFLAFPAHPDSILLFGQGYALDRLANIGWLLECPLHYWGDIDTHGFAILDHLRAHFPQAQSLLMDRETLLEHRPVWGEEPADKRCCSTLRRLNDSEQALYQDLRDDLLGERLRLEQEHIRFGWLQQALRELDSA